MSRPQLLSRLAIGLLIAACGLARGMADSGDEAVTKEAPDGAPQPSIEMREAGDESKSVEHSEEASNSTQAAKRGDHQEADQRDALLILLLEILRSSK